MSLPFGCRWKRSHLLVVSLLVPVTGCDGPSERVLAQPNPLGSRDERAATGIPSDAADIRGVVTLVQQGLDARPQAAPGAPSTPVACPPDCGGGGTPLQGVLIEEHPGEANRGSKSYVTVLREARLLRRTASGVERIEFGDLRVGQRAEVWFSGPVLESYPTQATAAVIVVDAR
jgi:hypothetical protein